ncbi:DUF2510 domain-containing protein [Nocardioides sp. SYSU DS0651]|uniref:DUF2510 domain-containing protein n=1 Tax=Nocardioides sp. SYSU DS0651 TaxID=3415955 RepID=UPI003F4B7047
MTNAGWYPDPAGAPNTYRYWDGQSWSQMTTNNPSGAAPGGPVQGGPGQGGPGQSAPGQGGQQPGPPEQHPGQQPTQHVGQQPGQPQPTQQPGQPYGAAPPPYPGAPQGPGGPAGPGAPGGYGQPGWGQPPAKGGGAGKAIAIAVAAVLVLVLIGVGGFFGFRALSDDDDPARGGDDPTTATDDGPESGSGGTEGPSSSGTVAPTGIQCTGGDPKPEEDPGETPRRISGGGLTIPRLGGYTVDLRVSEALTFADDIVVQYSFVSDQWVSEYAVGALPKDSGFEDPAQAAEIVMQCLTMNDQVYRGFDTRTDVKNEAITVDGRPAHLITSEIRVDDPDVSLEGDVTSVVVVDTGDPETFGVYLGVVPIGDTNLIAQQERVIDRIRVS